MIRRRPQRFFCFLIAAASAVAGEHTWTPAREFAGGAYFTGQISPTLEYSELRCRQGDDPRWKETEWDDAAWGVVGFRSVPSHSGIIWLRFRVRDRTAGVADAIHLNVPMAYEIYWDGILIGRSGTPGNTRNEEVPGNTINLLTVPADRRGTGEHVVAVRASNCWDRFPGAITPVMIFPGAAPDLFQFAQRTAILPPMAVGAMLMVTLTSFVMWLLAARLPVLLIFAALCLCATTLQALYVAFVQYGYPYSWNYWGLLARGYAIDGVGLCLFALMIVLFKLSRLSWLAVLALLVAGVTMQWSGPAPEWPLLAVAFGPALFAAGWAIWRRRLGATLVFGGLLVTTVIWLRDAHHFIVTYFLQGFLPTLLGLTSAIALQVRDERRKARDVQLTAARMEIELLMKNLQPHFLMNTLAVITEVVEQDPRSAVKLIDDLADGSRSLARLSAENLIPLAQELELCRAHLRVMSVRTGRAWRLDAAGVDGAALVPPAVFLTLIENGFAHQRVAEGAATFTLTGGRGADDATRYTFLSPGDVQTDSTRPAGGTGLRYVKARLEESFPGRWRMFGERSPEGWQTVIEIADGGRLVKGALA